MAFKIAHEALVNASQTARRIVDLLQIKLRDSLVRARVAVINSVRFTLKSLGYRVSNPSNERFHKVVLDEVPDSVRALIAHGVASIADSLPVLKRWNSLSPGWRPRTQLEDTRFGTIAIEL